MNPADLKPAGESASAPSNFIRDIIVEDLKTSKYGGRVHTRFPPEPNGYLHIGHAKSLYLNFGLAAEFGGLTNLRFDDTNPEKEEQEYVDSIIDTIHWLGYDWDGRLFYASDYFPQLYEWAVQLIKAGKAYVCDLTAEQVREYRGTLTEPGKESPYRNRSVEENLDLFARMKAGEFPDGSRTLRAKIDMAAANLNLRDPVMYRILHAEHHRTGNEWCIYPMYDFAHGQSDSVERITHSICTLEFEDHRPLYDWYVEQLGIYHPQQIEFDRLNLTYTMMSKRKLLKLVQDGLVSGWDDPRMPTLSGLRRRGYTPEAIRNFCASIGVSKTNGTLELGLLEHHLREDLNRRALRVMAVLRPLRLVIDDYPEGQVDELEAVNNPEDASAGTRRVPFSRVLYIEQDDFREVPPKQYYRLSPGKEVRLRYGYFVTCTGVVKNESGEVTEIHCTYDPQTRGGNAPDGRKVKSTIHWVSAAHAVDAEVRLYDNLFTKPNPNDAEPGQDFTANLNPNSLEVLRDAKLEPSLAEPRLGTSYQFERLGYFCADPDTAPGHPVFNRTVALRDTWARIEAKGARGQGPGRSPVNRPVRRTDERSSSKSDAGRRYREPPWPPAPGPRPLMLIIGIGGIGGDAACAVLQDGVLVAAIEEAKLTRQPGRSGELPAQAIAACLRLAGARPEQVDAVAVVRPIPDHDFHLKLRAQFPAGRILIVEHHLAHAASAYYASPFEEATVLALDRGGDFRSGTRWQGRGTRLTIEQEQYFSDSLGDLYGRVTELLDFKWRADEHKVQWLSASGDERFRELFSRIIGCAEAGPRFERSYFSGERLRHGRFSARLYEGLGLKDGEAVPECLKAHVAAGVQRAVEDAAIRMAGRGRNLCLAGGLGLNALFVAAMENRSGFENVFVQPAAGNAGTAIGAVLETWHGALQQERRVALDTLSLGPAFSAAEIKQVLENCKLRFHYAMTHDEIIRHTVEQLNDNRIVAWMQGRMEFGPRALGNRSILASPLDPYSTENLNIFIKHREPFRKFAASAPAELCAEYFEAGPNARFLATVGRVRPAHRERFAAAILADDLVRVHAVEQRDNPLYWKLLHAAGESTGLPVLYNTSFNLFGEPLVCTPRDAVRSFYASGIDAMLVGNFFLQK